MLTDIFVKFKYLEKGKNPVVEDLNAFILCNKLDISKQLKKDEKACKDERRKIRLLLTDRWKKY